MRKSVLGGIAALAVVASPASAVGLGDLAKVVLGGKSVLKKAESKCGATATLTAQENSTIAVALAAVKNALQPAQFQSLEGAAEADASKQATNTNFCNETKTKKKGLLKKIGSAGAKILTGGLGL